MNVDEELDRLYGLPLDEFTPARNALASELRKAGEREAADEVKALSKPSISAWTVNQLARKERMQVRSLLTAGERLRKAQEKLVRGGSRDELQQALERQREVVAALLESAQEVLDSAGHPATDATLARIRGTLTAAAADEEGTQLLQQGRLTEDLDPTGFGPVAPGAGAPAKAPRRAKARKEDAEAKRRVEEAKQEVARLRAEVREQERAAKAARKAAEKEEKELERLGARLESAEQALERARST
jgi:hypothetical protein